MHWVWFGYGRRKEWVVTILVVTILQQEWLHTALIGCTQCTLPPPDSVCQTRKRAVPFRDFSYFSLLRTKGSRSHRWQVRGQIHHLVRHQVSQEERSNTFDLKWTRGRNTWKRRLFKYQKFVSRWEWNYRQTVIIISSVILYFNCHCQMALGCQSWTSDIITLSTV